MPNKRIPYNPKLKELARKLRKQGIAGEVMLWKQVQRRAFGVEFHRQVPMLDYIVDFYCHELMLAIEIDGLSHQFDDVMNNDELRQQKLEAYGVVFIRFSDAEIKNNMKGVVQHIASEVERLLAARNNQ